MRLDGYWAFQRRFTAFARLLDAIGKAEQRDRLREFLMASEEEAKQRNLADSTATIFFGIFLTINPFAQGLFKEIGGGGFDLFKVQWLETADSASLDEAVAYLIENLSQTPGSSLIVATEGRRRVIKARLGLDNLEDALEWMIWNGYWMKNPLKFCQECQEVIPRESAHTRKYCKYECAHRATDRAWRRKKRAREKEGRRT